MHPVVAEAAAYQPWAMTTRTTERRSSSNCWPRSSQGPKRPGDHAGRGGAKCQGVGKVRLVRLPHGPLQRVVESIELGRHLGFEFLAMLRQPGLAPDVGLLGDDAAISLDMLFELIKVPRQGLNGRRFANVGFRSKLTVMEMDQLGNIVDGTTTAPKRYRQYQGQEKKSVAARQSVIHDDVTSADGCNAHRAPPDVGRTDAESVHAFWV